MIIEVDGIQYSGWTSASAKLRLDSVTNEFNFNATSKDGKPLPFKGKEKCTVFVDGEKILTGHIEIVTIDGDAKKHDISITGRDRTGDIIDSKIGSVEDIRPIVSLKKIIQAAIKHIGSDVKVEQAKGLEIADFVKSEDLAAPEPGQPIWDFIESLARKRQVLLSSTPDGDVLITRSSGIEVDATLQHKINDNKNNVLSYSVSYDTTGRYNVYRISSQLSPVALIHAGTVLNSKIVSQDKQVSDGDIRIGRQFVLVAENAGANPLDRAKWERNVRRSRGRVYGVTVHGFRNQTGNLWAINELVQVVDEFADINSRMLVNTVQFTLSDTSGRNTTMSLIEKDAYNLEVAEPTTDEFGGST